MTENKIEDMKDEIEDLRKYVNLLEDKIIELQNDYDVKIVDLERENNYLADKCVNLEEYQASLEYNLEPIAQAIHEIQEYLRKEGMFIINDIYAPTRVKVK